MSDTETPIEMENSSNSIDDEAPNSAEVPQDSPDEADEDQTDEDAETFDRAYVEKLRKESARYREKARNADAHAHRLHTELVRATGRLADPSDLPFDESRLDDPDALAEAIEELLNKKPHLAARRPMGDIGQGATATRTGVDLAGMLRQRA